MAFSNNLNGRMEELRFPNLRSPDVEAPYTAGLAPNRDSNPFFPGMNSSNSNDVRATLQRRFTTDSSKLSVSRPFSQQYSSFNNSASIKQKQIYEDIQDARRKAQEQLALLDLQERNLQLGGGSQDLDRVAKGFNRISLNGPVSEPTTPPDYSEDVFSNRFSRSSRISGSGITSPPGLTKRMSQSSSKITSPPSTRHSNQGLYSVHRHSTKSMPGSRRGSDEDEYYPEDLPAVRSAATFNRFSMPVNGSRNSHRLSMSTALPNHVPAAFDTSFLLEGDEDNQANLTSPIAQAYAQLGGDDTFPTLTSDGQKLSANSAALDLANNKSSNDDWLVGSRPRVGHASMPHTDSSMYRPVLSNLSSPPADRPAELSRRKSQRHSMGVTFDESAAIPPVPNVRPASLQTSYSTNDVPTVRNSVGAMDSIMSPSKSQAEQQFHQHNISLGRIPANAVNNRQSRELINGNGVYRPEENSANSTQSNLQASAAPFGPSYTTSVDASLMALTSTANGAYAAPQASMYGFNVQNYSTVNNIHNVVTPNNAMIAVPNGYNAMVRPQDNQARGAARRHHDETRFNNVPIESYRGSLYELCKDQHGCRYLQRKLEDGQVEHVQMIFQETCPHIIELMTDPFGNYLCQKLFEHCTDQQRTSLINTAAPSLTIIALNQHGTRALQKMIEFVHTDVQINTIIQALSPRVVELVQDLNGNHVIQKCLTRLGAERSQFIYDAVGNYCVVVGTHRHGCCVLQRCIDHSHGQQRDDLIANITRAAFDLVQDPFGNYVVQYILDLDESKYTTPLCEAFKTRVVALSRQKFSSNVIEKCLRTALPATKKVLINEMLMGNELESMLRDSFANYVVQTAMDYADEETKLRIIDVVRPILPSIKQTPHGRRIATKITSMPEYQGRVSGTSSGALTPTETYPQGSFGRANRRNVQIVGGGFNRPGFNGVGQAPSADVQTTHPINQQPNQFPNGNHFNVPIVNNNNNHNFGNGHPTNTDFVNSHNGTTFSNGQSVNGYTHGQNGYTAADYNSNPTYGGGYSGFQNTQADSNYI